LDNDLASNEGVLLLDIILLILASQYLILCLILDANVLMLDTNVLILDTNILILNTNTPIKKNTDTNNL